MTRTQSAFYSISDDRLAAVVAAVSTRTGRPADDLAEAVRDYLLADWSEGDEHQQWLDSAPVGEIADWFMVGQPA